MAEAIGHGYTHSMVSMVERGHRTMGFGALVQAARVLDVSLDYLAGLTDDPTPAAKLVSELADARAARQPDHNI